MIYQYFRCLNWIFMVFGLKMPFLSTNGKPSAVTIINKCLTLFLAGLIITEHAICLHEYTYVNIKSYLTLIVRTNTMLISVYFLVIYLIKGEEICSLLYETVENIISKLRVSEASQKWFAVKFFTWFSIPFTLIISFAVYEIVITNGKHYVIILKMPIFLLSLHLLFHLYLFVALLRAMNNQLNDVLNFYPETLFILDTTPFKSRVWVFKYLLSPDVAFPNKTIRTKPHHVDLKYFCVTYDEIASCVRLLEEYQGFEALLSMWMFFVDAVYAITTIACNAAEYPILNIWRSGTIFSWVFITCYIGNQLSGQVKTTEVTIVKALIDYRCVEPKKSTLQTFKVLVSGNQLQFKVGNLFYFNYTMLVGTVINIITYSLIMIQLFISKQ